MISSVGSSERIFVACYMLFFSALLFFFELNQMRPVEYIDHMYRRNFGFLYGALTKSLFIILYVILPCYSNSCIAILYCIEIIKIFYFLIVCYDVLYVVLLSSALG